MLNKPIWENYLNMFIRTQNEKAKKTIKAYRGGVSAFLRYMVEHEIEKPLPDDIHDFVRFLREHQYSVFTTNLYMIALKLFFADLTERDLYPDIYIMANPQIKRPDRKKHYRDTLTDDEVFRLRQLFLNKEGQKACRDLLMIDLALYGGLRANEIANVKIDDLMHDGDKYKLFVLSRGETRKNHFKWVNDMLALRIKQYCRQYDLDEYVFTDISHRGSGGHLCSSTVSTLIGRYLKQAKVKRESTTADSLRHYADYKGKYK